MGEVIDRVEKCRGPHGYLSLSLVRDAIIDLDVDAIEQIVRRVDGTVPAETERGKCANLLGDAIEDILAYDDIAQIMRFTPDEPVIIMMAKALYIIAVRPCGKDRQKRKDKAKAMDMIFERTGGRKVEPTKAVIENKYDDPDWMKGLPEGRS